MFRKLAVIAAGIALLGLGTAPVSAQTAPNPQISLTKTVTTEPGVCGTESSIEIEAGTTVYYCYTVTNTGNVLFDFHTLVDDQLGPLFSNLGYDLLPDSSVSTVAAGLTIPAVITEDTVNVGTWTACNEPLPNGTITSPQQIAPSCVEELSAEATATAVVTIAETPPTTPTTPPPAAAEAATAAPAVAAAGTPRFTG